MNGLTSSAGHVLVVEDDPSTRELIAVVLRRGGHQVAQAGDAGAAMDAFRTRPDLVLLDIGLPDDDGFMVLDRLRAISECPVIMLSGAGDESAKVRALMRGADDYLVKPVSAPELLARVAAVLRRSRRRPGSTGADAYDDGELQVDLLGRSVRIRGRELAMTPLEYRLLSAFVRHPHVILSRGELVELAWGDPAGSPDDHVKLAVAGLRRKLSSVLPGDSIETVRGFGYRWARSPLSADRRAVRRVTA